MSSNEWELDAEFELAETPKELFVKTSGERADDYEAVIRHSELDPSVVPPNRRIFIAVSSAMSTRNGGTMTYHGAKQIVATARNHMCGVANAI